MRLPGILRRLSSMPKTRCGTSDGDSGPPNMGPEVEPTPPLPTHKSLLIQRNTSALMEDGSQTDENTSGHPDGAVTEAVSHALSANITSNGFSMDLVDAWNVSHKEQPNGTGLTKVLNSKSIKGHVAAANGAQTVLKTVMTPVNALVATPEVAKAIERGVNEFREAVPILMKALDEVAKIHPFISVAILAFKAAYTLESTRQENNRKVTSLYVEMKDMVAVLVRLKDVKDVEQRGLDNQTIKDRLQELTKNTAVDIKNCANTCDAYLKKKLLVKIFAGPIWEEKLLAFVSLFTERRQQFGFALTVHSAVGVDEANIKLIDIDGRTREINMKMEVMLQMFQRFVTPKEQQIAAYIQSKGGKSAFENETSIKELVAYEAKLSVPHRSDTRHHGQGAKGDGDLTDLRSEIGQNPEEAIAKNAEPFDRKFEVQKRQIEAEIARAMRREGDRIISAVTGGSHDRIVDVDIYNIWKDMGWRGSVKARHFVLALRDYFLEKLTSRDSEDALAPDKWTLDCIHLNYAQPILEAFDDDASGFITVQEVNRLTQLRPRDWSLPHWIAYWAVGWQMTVADYCEKIDGIFAAMFHLLNDVKPVNRSIVDGYLVDSWNNVMVLTQSVEKPSGRESLKAKFEPWVTAEEERLRKNLAEIRYDIESYDTVGVITGPGRIEIFLYPLLYLILKRHLEIISLGRTHDLGKEELWDALDTLIYVVDAAFDRLGDMKSIFKQQRVDKTAQLKIFAYGMFAHLDEAGIFSGDNLRNLPDPQVADEGLLPGNDLDPKEILNHPVHVEQTKGCSAYDPIIIQAQEQWTGTDAILGSWYGLLFIENFPLIPKISIVLERGDTDQHFRASGEHYDGGDVGSFDLEGHTGPEVDGFVPVSFQATYSTRYDTITFDGKLDVVGGSIRGEWSFSSGTGGDFVFKRSPETLRFYPSPMDVLESPAHTRWKFALNSVRDRVERDLWSKSFFLDRFRNRKRYIELGTRKFHYGKELNRLQNAELRELYRSLDYADTRFYASLIRHKLAITSIHTSIWCNRCGSPLGTIRSICIDCRANSSIDFCEDPACTGATVSPKDHEWLKTPHLPTHNIFRVHSVLHGRYFAKTERKAKEALATARKLLSVDNKLGPEATEKPTPTCLNCKTTVSLKPPCWACVECDEVFICDDCDSKNLAFNEKHDQTHAVVQCKPASKNTVSTEDRLMAIEARLTEMERVLNAFMGKLKGEGRTQVEGVLEQNQMPP